MIGQGDIQLPFVQNMFSIQEIKENMGTNHQNEKENSLKFSDSMESILKSMGFYIPAISSKKAFQKKMCREATQITGYMELYVIKMYKSFIWKMIPWYGRPDIQGDMNKCTAILCSLMERLNIINMTKYFQINL